MAGGLAFGLCFRSSETLGHREERLGVRGLVVRRPVETVAATGTASAVVGGWGESRTATMTLPVLCPVQNGCSSVPEHLDGSSSRWNRRYPSSTPARHWARVYSSQAMPSIPRGRRRHQAQSGAVAMKPSLRPCCIAKVSRGQRVKYQLKMVDAVERTETLEKEVRDVQLGLSGLLPWCFVSLSR
jgi:hypothetical protein